MMMGGRNSDLLQMVIALAVWVITLCRSVRRK